MIQPNYQYRWGEGLYTTMNEDIYQGLTNLTMRTSNVVDPEVHLAKQWIASMCSEYRKHERQEFDKRTNEDWPASDSLPYESSD